MSNQEAALIQQILDGNLDAFTELFGLYEARVWRYAASIVDVPDDADDVVQEAFIKAYQNLRTYNLRRPFSPWLYRIVRNEALNHRRREQKYVTGEPGSKVLDAYARDDISAHQQVEKKEMKAIVQASLRRLPLQYREPILLFYLEGRKYEEISDILRIPMNTVATRIRRGKQVLKTIVEAQGVSDGR